MTRPGGDEPLYTISIAARLVRRETPQETPLHPQTLRMYEKKGWSTRSGSAKIGCILTGILSASGKFSD